jgi:uncharacterized protein YndB with AHSA1/START domain
LEPIVVQIDIDRSPADVYAYATDPRHFPEWQKDVAAAKVTDGAPGAFGSTFDTTRHFAGMQQSLTQEVIEAEPPNRWASRGVTGAIRANAAVTIAPLNGGRSSRVTFSITYDSGWLGKAVMPMVVRQTKSGAPKSFQNLKAILEQSG